MRTVAQELDMDVQREKSEFERRKVRRYDPILVMEKNVHVEGPEGEEIKNRRNGESWSTRTRRCGCPKELLSCMDRKLRMCSECDRERWHTIVYDIGPTLGTWRRIRFTTRKTYVDAD